MDLISRQAAIEDVKSWEAVDGREKHLQKNVIEWLKEFPSAQPDIIRCRECKFASGDSRICMKFDHSPIGELDFCSFAERREATA